ncbi:BglG family transcription antiterminator [Anaerostipes butyraticus]|uniref:BglG family transcription antiterminator n=1 Tax=Anaerostipes butyraticus TaxID=645466 RepID=UPI003208D3AA
MDYRSSRIITSVMNREKIKIAYLAKQFHVSERVVRKLVRELNEELKEQGLPSLKIDSKGVVDFEERNQCLHENLKKFLNHVDFYIYRLNSSERKTICAMILMNSEGYVTAAELSERLEISRNTAIADLNELKDWFSSNQMELSSQVQKGYKVKGKEDNIRNGILKLIELNPDYSNYENGEVWDVFNHLLLQELEYEKRMPVIQKIVSEEEGHYNFYFSDFSFMETVFEILILVKRLSKGKVMEDMDESIKRSSKYPFSEGILDRTGEAFSIEIPESEKKKFVQCLRRKSYLKSSTKNVDEIALPVIIGEAIYHISESFNISFYLDFGLYDVLVDHMKSAIYRARSGEYLRNPFGSEIETKYPEVFRVVDECVKPLEKYIGKQFQKDEISFLAMYFASMIEKQKMEQTKEQKVPVMLVGAMGRGTMKLFETEMEHFDDILEIVEIRSSHENTEISHKNIRMIISMVPYHSEGIPCVKISGPILKKDEICDIRMTAMDVLEEMQRERALPEQETKDLTLKKEGESFLKEDGILLNAEAENWEEAVRISGRLLYRTGMVKESYIEAMVDTIRENGDYVVIYPDLAIPHAEAEKGAVKEGISFVRLKKPVCFLDHKDKSVTYVIGLSVLNADSINDILYNLVKMFSNDAFKEKLNAIKTEKEMYELIRDKI